MGATPLVNLPPEFAHLNDDVLFGEVITHAAFYAGWPKAWVAFRIAKDVWADDAPQKKDD